MHKGRATAAHRDLGIARANGGHQVLGADEHCAQGHQGRPTEGGRGVWRDGAPQAARLVFPHQAATGRHGAVIEQVQLLHTARQLQRLHLYHRAGRHEPGEVQAQHQVALGGLGEVGAVLRIHQDALCVFGALGEAHAVARAGHQRHGVALARFHQQRVGQGHLEPASRDSARRQGGAGKHLFHIGLAQGGLGHQHGEAPGRVGAGHKDFHAGEPARLRHQHGLREHGALHHVVGGHHVPIGFFPAVHPHARDAQELVVDVGARLVGRVHRPRLIAPAQDAGNRVVHATFPEGAVGAVGERFAGAHALAAQGLLHRVQGLVLVLIDGQLARPVLHAQAGDFIEGGEHQPGRAGAGLGVHGVE
ncbi:hypothetical protein D3C71_975350 [compost metagenome]